MGQPIDTAEVEIIPDFSDFARRLKSGIDSAMRELQSTVTQAFARIEDAAGSAGRDVGREFQQGGERAESAFREISRTAATSFAQVDASAATASAGMSGKLGGALGFIKTGLLGVGLAAGAGLLAMTAFGLKSAASIEQTQISFDSLLGSAEEGKRVFDSLKEFANVTPFELGDITPLAQKFLSFSAGVGLSKDQLEQFLTTAGNIASVTGGGAQALNSIGLAFSHISSGGKVSLEDINILSDALPGFSGVAAIAAKTGMSTGDAMAAISAGSIDAKTGVDALLAGMATFPGAAGAMAKQAETLGGVFSTFKDTVGQSLSNAFAPVIPEIKSALSDLTPVIGQAIGQLAPSLGSALSSILPLVGQLIQGIVPILSPILDALGPALTALGPSLVPLGEAIGELVTALAPVLPILAEFIGVLAQLAIPIIKLLAAILLPLTPILNFVARAIGEVGRALGMIDWAAVGAAIGAFVTDAWNKTGEMFAKIFAIFTQVKDAAKNAFESVKNAIIDGFNTAVDFVASLPGRFLALLGQAKDTLVQTGKDLVSGLWNGISSLGGWLWNQVTSFLYNNTVGAAKKILGIASPSTVFAEQVGAQIPAGIAQGVQSGMADLQGLISPIVPGGGSTTGAGGASLAGAITINVNVNGSATAADARRIGAAAGDGVMAALQRRSIGLAVRTA